MLDDRTDSGSITQGRDGEVLHRTRRDCNHWFVLGVYALLLLSCNLSKAGQQRVLIIVRCVMILILPSTCVKLYSRVTMTSALFPMIVGACVDEDI